MQKLFSFKRFYSVYRKEFIHIKRDPLTAALIILFPLIQLILFGYAINTNPKHLPAAILSYDNSSFTRSFIDAIENTDYFKINKIVKNENEAKELITRGDVLFVFSIPTNFTKRLIRGEHPAILVEVDATDPVATGAAVAAINVLGQTVFDKPLRGSLNFLQSKSPPAKFITHAKYNPESITQYNIVPGLVGFVITMTMVIITSMSITREYENGTMESLLATPVRPLEVMLGKIMPYLVIGYLQFTLILLAAFFLFKIPIEGSVLLLYLTALPFIVASLAVGLLFSTLAKNQVQGMQMAFFYLLPSILLSGYIFPFAGMPGWAHFIGSLLPLTYFIRIIRGIMLKGSGFIDLWPEILPLFIFIVVVLFMAVRNFRETLD